MILAAVALLSMSLNAQNGAKKVVEASPASKITAMTSNEKAKPYSGKNAVPTMNELVAGIKGMSSILPECNSNGTSASGPSRAPKMLNSGEYLVGPYTTNDFSTNGIGFSNAYNDGQQIYIFADLDRSAFADHDGDEIVGFRFALPGTSSDKSVLYDFHAWPYGTNGYFEAANRHTWSIPEYTGAQPISSFDDIVITVATGLSTNFSSIYVYDQNNNVLTSWSATSTDVGQVQNSGGTTSTYYNMPDGWTLSNVYMFQYGSGSSAIGYLSTNGQGTITIDGTILAGSTSVRLVINGYSDNGTETISVDNVTKTITTTSDSYTWNLSPTGTSAPVYVELEGGQWHEFYLDEPIPFSVADSIVGMYLGYRYFQYPSTETSEFLYPIAVNPNSTVTDHVSYRYGSQGASYSDIVITPYSSSTNFRSIVVKSNGTTVTSWVGTTNGQTLPTGWTCSDTWRYSSSYGGYTSGYLTIDKSLFSSGSNITLEISAYGDNASQTITVNSFSPVAITTSEPSTPYTWNIEPTTTYTSGWWSEDFSQYGDLAVQLIFKESLPKTATPVITSEVVDGNVVITATGDGTVTLTVDGQSATGEGSVSITIPCGTEERTVTATATAQEAGKEVSDEATASITIPEAGRSPKPTINYSWDGDVCTITATGTGDVHMYVDGVEVTQPYVVEKGSVERTITVTATNQETGLAISHEAEQEIVIPTINMSGFTQLNPQPANADAPIDLSKVMFVDRFSVEIPEDNSHPLRYDYTLEETQAAQRQSNTVPVFAQHTGSNGLGFYTLDQIKSDSIPSLKMNVMNAAMDFNLSPTSDPYFYTVEREDMGSNNEPYWDWTAVLQRTSDGKYKETKRPLYNYDSIYSPGPHVQLDLDTITGDYNDYKAYVPVVWTMGFDRVNYPVDETHNSYGAHVWRTGVAKAEVVSVTAERQSGMHTTWNDGTADCSLYFLKIHAKGYMPTANTLKYVPYMFRVFVKSKTGKLRGFVPVNNTNGQGQHPENDPNFDNFTGPLAIWDEYVDLEDYDGSTIVDFYKWDTDTTEWTKNIMFAATDDLTGAFEQGNTSPIDINDLEVFVRFYYVVPGMLPAPNSLRAGGGNGPAGYGAQSPGKGPDPSTDIVEVFYNHGAVESRVYYNMQGVRSDKPFDGINVVVTRYMDGTTTTTKVVR